MLLYHILYTTQSICLKTIVVGKTKTSLMLQPQSSMLTLTPTTQFRFMHISSPTSVSLRHHQKKGQIFFFPTLTCFQQHHPVHRLARPNCIPSTHTPLYTSTHIVTPINIHNHPIIHQIPPRNLVNTSPVTSTKFFYSSFFYPINNTLFPSHQYHLPIYIISHLNTPTRSLHTFIRLGTPPYPLIFSLKIYPFSQHADPPFSYF